MRRLLPFLALLCTTVLTAGPAKPLVSAITFHTIEEEFDAAFPGLRVDDLEDVNVGPGMIMACPSPASSASSNLCFDAFDIAPGVSLGHVGPSRPNDGLAIAGPGFAGLPDRSVLANYFTDSFRVDFDKGTMAVGMSLVRLGAGTTCDIVARARDGTVGTLQTPCDARGRFVGISSNESPIMSVVVTATDALEGIRSIKFIAYTTCAQDGLAGRTIAETVAETVPETVVETLQEHIHFAGVDELNETGPVSSQVHAMEGTLGAAAPAAHEASCFASAGGL